MAEMLRVKWNLKCQKCGSGKYHFENEKLVCDCCEFVILRRTTTGGK